MQRLPVTSSSMTPNSRGKLFQSLFDDVADFLGIMREELSQPICKLMLTFIDFAKRHCSKRKPNNENILPPYQENKRLCSSL